MGLAAAETRPQCRQAHAPDRRLGAMCRSRRGHNRLESSRQARRRAGGMMLVMARVAPLSGFPEWLPGGRVIEEHVLDVMTSAFALHGYAAIETRAVEPVESLLSKGETSK